jgi:hypothetical protein
MMEAASTSETLISFYHTTLHNIPEDSRLFILKCSLEDYVKRGHIFVIIIVIPGFGLLIFFLNKKSNLHKWASTHDYHFRALRPSHWLENLPQRGRIASATTPPISNQ